MTGAENTGYDRAQIYGCFGSSYNYRTVRNDRRQDQTILSKLKQRQSHELKKNTNKSIESNIIYIKLTIKFIHELNDVIFLFRNPTFQNCLN